MTVTISAFFAVLLVVALHTVLSHLLNWAWRNAEGNDQEEGIIISLFVIEAFIAGFIIYLILT